MRSGPRAAGLKQMLRIGVKYNRIITADPEINRVMDLLEGGHFNETEPACSPSSRPGVLTECGYVYTGIARTLQECFSLPAIQHPAINFHSKLLFHVTHYVIAIIY